MGLKRVWRVIERHDGMNEPCVSLITEQGKKKLERGLTKDGFERKGNTYEKDLSSYIFYRR